MEVIEYPTTDYNSWLDEDEAEEYFESRLRSEEWYATSTDTDATLITAFRSLQELDLNIEFDSDKLISDSYYSASEIAEILSALQQAQCEQALHELKNDLDSPNISRMSLGGLLSVDMPEGQDQTPRYSERALAILRPYIKARTVARTR
jgi:hypothetical protein